jgi:NAD-dependent deacetylase
MNQQQDLIEATAKAIKNSKYCVGFTGAGISVESGILPFRGEGGIFETYDPQVFDIDFFTENTKKAWQMLNEIFYKVFDIAHPNNAHKFLTALEKKGIMKSIITQNIDYLHQKAGCKEVYEFHGNNNNARCLECGEFFEIKTLDLSTLPPKCNKCNRGALKPDFVFFGEQIPRDAYIKSLMAIQNTDLLIIIGTTGVVMPAAMLPIQAKKENPNCKIIEINPEESRYTNIVVDIFLEGKAGEICTLLAEKLKLDLE